MPVADGAAVFGKGRIAVDHDGVSSSAGVSRLPDSTRRFRTLTGLSNRELLSRVKDLVSRERAVTLEILVHLIEVERRRLYLGLGYPSLFEYCVRHLGYSSSGAGRRIPAARCIRDYPEVYRLLEKNEVNLSSISLVAPILTKENKDDLLRRIRNKSQKEVEAIAAGYRPPVSMRDRARPVCVAVASSTLSASGSSMSGAPTAMSSDGSLESLALATATREACAASPSRQPSACDYSRSGSEKTPNAAVGEAGGPPRLERKFQVQFLASERFMKKFEKAKALLSNKNAPLSYEAVLEAALDEFLKDHDPEERERRREERREKTQEGTNRSKRSTAGPERTGSRTNPPKREKIRGVRPQPATSGGGGHRGLTGEHAASPHGGAEPSRHIPAAVRDAVFVRDKGRCTYTGPDGKRCESMHNLQVDHIVPFARGGTATLRNLRLLCGKHNRLNAERVFGPRAPRRR